MTRNRLRALVLAGAVLAGGPVLAACGDDNDAGGMGEDSEPIEENQDNAGDTSGDHSGYNEP